MKMEYFFDKIGELKEKFKGFFQHRKKIKALENYSEVERFPHKNYLSLVKNCINDGFLEEQESAFLDHMLDKYEIKYLDWAHRTKWLKKEMAERRTKYPASTSQLQTFFNFEPKESKINVPLEILGKNPTHPGARVR